MGISSFRLSTTEADDSHELRGRAITELKVARNDDHNDHNDKMKTIRTWQRFTTYQCAHVRRDEATDTAMMMVVMVHRRGMVEAGQ